MTAVRFLRVSDGPPYLISGSADAYICLWQPHIGSDNHLDYRLRHSQKIHSASITCLSVTCQIDAFFVSGSADSTIVTWVLNLDGGDCEFVPTQIIHPTRALIPLCLALHMLSDNRVILAAGGTKSEVLLFVLHNRVCSCFRPYFAVMRVGYEPWISRKLSIHPLWARDQDSKRRMFFWHLLAKTSIFDFGGCVLAMGRLTKEKKQE